ncbi:hypothetical protein DFJ74DRAFT_663647 [Hyaloraphidium curvatum]|nr:hypothetical protein DFJ74DRAFT_663628 [Hyaloraphidium curvatum]KAI9026250.1 hypothetical protein DFJ74DRAFT_663647 [Hyaloraphidium curvatum]
MRMRCAALRGGWWLVCGKLAASCLSLTLALGVDLARLAVGPRAARVPTAARALRRDGSPGDAAGAEAAGILHGPPPYPVLPPCRPGVRSAWRERNISAISLR